MNDKTPQKEVLDTYLKRIAENLYFTIESISILRVMDKNIEKIKELNFEHFFIPLQRPLINDVILSLSKIFEENKDSITIKKIQQYLESNQKTVRIESNCINSLQKYKHFDFYKLETYNEIIEHEISLEPFKGHIHKTEYYTFKSKDFLNILNKNINQLYEEFKKDLKALKELRDKNIAHSDKKSIQNKTTWNKIDKLIEFIKEYVDMLSWIYLSTAWSGDNSEAFSLANAEGTSFSFERLLKSMEVDNFSK